VKPIFGSRKLDESGHFNDKAGDSRCLFKQPTRCIHPTFGVRRSASSKAVFFIANGSNLPRAKIEDEFEDDNKRGLARGREMLGRIVAMLIRLGAKLPTLITIDFSSVRRLCPETEDVHISLNDPRVQLLGYSALTTSRNARIVEARLSRFQTMAKAVVRDRPLIGR
jgi:hypothetical protein